MREFYPYHEEADRLIRRLRPEVELGTIRGVVGVRIIVGTLVITTSKGSLAINLGLPIDDFEFEGFGKVERRAKARSDFRNFIRLERTRSVTLDDHGVIYGIWGGDIRIETEEFTFVISLLGDGEYDPEDEPPD